MLVCSAMGVVLVCPEMTGVVLVFHEKTGNVRIFSLV